MEGGWGGAGLLKLLTLQGSRLFLPVPGDNIALFRARLPSTLANGSRFAYHFQRHKQEMTRVEFALPKRGDTKLCPQD